VEAARILLTGASGFLGRHLVEALGDRFEIVAVSRASPSTRGATPAACREWLFLDVGDAAAVAAAAERLRRQGPIDAVVHLAGHYDFTGEPRPEYQRTNVEGTRNVLAAARLLGARDFIFASSVAACRFPAAGRVLDERSPVDGETPYGESKRLGEEMVAAQHDGCRGWIVRFGALFSDWCEYEPLYRFLEIWLSDHPRRRVLAGHGLSAVPYLHVRDSVSFLETLLERRDRIDPREVLIASNDGATTHREIFEVATAAHFGERERPLLVPKSLCRTGLGLRQLATRAGAAPIFERPWMGRYIDLQLRVDAARTRERLGWAPRPRLDLCRRIPFLVQNRKSIPVEWHRRNQAAMRLGRLHENLHVHRLLEQRAAALAAALARHLLAPERRDRFLGSAGRRPERIEAECALLVDALLEAVRTGEKVRFRDACRELAAERCRAGLAAEELTATLDVLNDLAVLDLAGESPGPSWYLALYDHLTMTVQFGIDEVFDVYDGPA